MDYVAPHSCQFFLKSNEESNSICKGKIVNRSYTRRKKWFFVNYAFKKWIYIHVSPPGNFLFPLRPRNVKRIMSADLLRRNWPKIGVFKFFLPFKMLRNILRNFIDFFCLEVFLFLLSDFLYSLKIWSCQLGQNSRIWFLKNILDFRNNYWKGKMCFLLRKKEIHCHIWRKNVKHKS